ncbi:MAG TPA: hypothetical protein VG033_07000 [Candidatus Acidoferrales bacterium]|jgi:hypothetical protein|nr:hypothetical protein [Candidatus Acidoferrales bacterium]
MESGVAQHVFPGLFATALSLALLCASPSPAHRESRPARQAAKSRSAQWAPPDVDAPLASLASSPPCSLPGVLEQAGERAAELVGNLQNFTAREAVRYEQLDALGAGQAAQFGLFDYVVDFKFRGSGLTVDETRKLTGGSGPPAGSVDDSGLPAIALIFLPAYQNDYDLRCEGLGQWNGQPAWVIHFQQRKGRPSRTRSFRTVDAVYPARLKGRAWIASDSYQILHVETNLMQAVPLLQLRGEAVSIDYAPVQFHSQEVQLWLPRAAEVFSDFGERRFHVRHDFSDFQLFSVSVRSEEKPKPPKP